MKNKLNVLQLIGKTYFLYYDRCVNIVIFIYQNIEEQPAYFSFEFFFYSYVTCSCFSE